MIQLRQAPVAAAMAAFLATAFVVPAPVHAQQQEVRSVETLSMHQKRELAKQKEKEKKGEATDARPTLYPQATRQEPGLTPSRKGIKKLQKLQDEYQNQDNKDAIALANEIGADPDSNAYEKSFAYLLGGSAAAAEDDQAAAADYFAKALAADGLPNNDHYTAMFNLAATQYGLDQYAQALATADRFLAETKSDKPDALKLKGGALIGLQRFDDAAALYVGMLEKTPDDRVLRLNAVSAYQQADKPEKATALLADAQAKGQLSTKEEYRALYVSYINDDKDNDAIKVIDDGVAKGIIPASPELAKDYMVLGQKAYYNDDVATAMEMYKRAAPMAADGEAALNLARIYAEKGRKADAKAAAEQALAKGVKDMAAARKLAGTK